MPGCWALTAAILMQKFPCSVKLTCPENQSLIRRRLEYWKHDDLAYQGYTYSLESNQALVCKTTFRMGWGSYNQRCNQPNEQLPNYRASPDFLLDLLDFLKSGDQQKSTTLFSLPKLLGWIFLPSLELGSWHFDRRLPLAILCLMNGVSHRINISKIYKVAISFLTDPV